MADEVTGGLPTEDTTSQVKAEQPKVGGLTIGTNKNVSLNASQSADIKQKLLDMIAAREQENTGLNQFVEGMMPFTGSPEHWASNVQAMTNRQNTRNQDIMNMRLGIAELDTQQERLAQAKAEKARNDQIFMTLLGGPQGAQQAAGVATSGARGSEPMAEVFALYQQDPKAAINKLIELRKPTDVERQLEAAGVQRGSPEWNQYMTVHVAGSGAFVPHDVRGVGGTQQQTPLQAAAANAPRPAAPAPGGALPAAVRPAAPAPAAGGALPAPQPRPQPQVQPAPQPTPQAAPQPTPQAAPVVQPQVQPVATGFAPGSKEDLEMRQQAAKTEMEGRAAEVRKLGEEFAAQQTAHLKEAEAAPGNAQMSQRMQADIGNAQSVLGKLAKAGSLNAFMTLVDKGVQIGNFGTLKIPGLQDALVKLDPAAKDQKVMDAYVRLGQDLTKMQLDYSQKVFKGQGAVSDNERRLISDTIGDRAHMTPQTLMQQAKAVELEARNRMEQDKLWRQMEKAGYTWRQYSTSPELENIKKQQFYRTAKVFGKTDAKWPGDQ